VEKNPKHRAAGQVYAEKGIESWRKWRAGGDREPEEIEEQGRAKRGMARREKEPG